MDGSIDMVNVEAKKTAKEPVSQEDLKDLYALADPVFTAVASRITDETARRAMRPALNKFIDDVRDPRQPTFTLNLARHIVDGHHDDIVEMLIYAAGKRQASLKGQAPEDPTTARIVELFINEFNGLRAITKDNAKQAAAAAHPIRNILYNVVATTVVTIGVLLLNKARLTPSDTETPSQGSNAVVFVCHDAVPASVMETVEAAKSFVKGRAAKSVVLVEIDDCGSLTEAQRAEIHRNDFRVIPPAPTVRATAVEPAGPPPAGGPVPIAVPATAPAHAPQPTEAAHAEPAPTALSVPAVPADPLPVPASETPAAIQQ